MEGDHGEHGGDLAGDLVEAGGVVGLLVPVDQAEHVVASVEQPGVGGRGRVDLLAPGQFGDVGVICLSTASSTLVVALQRWN